MSDQNSTNNKGFNSLGRMNRGMEIAQKKTISENADGSFSVPSATVDEILYLVRFVNGKYLCNCLDFKERVNFQQLTNKSQTLKGDHVRN